MNIKKIVIVLKNDTELEFQPKFDAHISEHRGTTKTYPNSLFIPQIIHNGRETLVIICAPPDILEELKPVIDNIIEKRINT